MACDICGDNTRPLHDLRSVYQTAEVKQVCGGCEAAINKRLSRARAVTHNILVDLVKQAIRGMRERKQGGTPE